MLRTDTEIRDTTADYPESRAGVADGEEWLRKNAPKAPARQVSPGNQQQGSDLMKQVIDTIYAKRGHPNPATAASPSIAPDLHQPEQVVPPNLDDLDKAHPIAWTRNEPTTAEMPMPPVPPPEETAQREMPAPPIPPPEPETPRKPMAGAGGDGAPEAFASDVPPPDAGQTPQEMQKSKLKHITAAYMPRAEPDGASPQASGGPVGTATSDREARLKAALEAAAQARAGSGLSGVASRFVEDATNLRGKRKPDYSIGNAYDAQDEARANRPLQVYAMDEQARTADRDARVKEATLALAQKKLAAKDGPPAENPAVTVEKLKEAHADAHPAAAKADHFAEGEANKDRRLQMQLNAKGAGGGLTPGQQALEDRDTAKRRDTNKQSFAKLSAAQSGLADALSELDATAPGVIGGDAKGLPGRLDATLAQFPITRGFSSDSAQKINALKARVQQMISLETSGKVLNGTELKNMGTFLGLDPFSDPQRFADALKLVRQGLRNSVERRDTAYGPTGGPEDRYAIIDEMRKADPGLLTAQHPIFAGMQGAAPALTAGTRTAASVTLRDTKTGKTYENIPADQAAAYLAKHPNLQQD